jgi:hypothetical protein
MSQKEKRTIKILLIIVASAAFIWFLGNLLLDFLSYKKSNIVMNERRCCKTRVKTQNCA